MTTPGMTYERPAELVAACLCPKCEFIFEQPIETTEEKIEDAIVVAKRVVEATTDRRFEAVKAQVTEILTVPRRTPEAQAEAFTLLVGVLREHRIWNP